ncbi:galactoside O-acetyltransferase [Enterococcus sp. AZ194]|uniref:sugar O-acetyltransferase n=1 Tax=Enterococcus sp. AZ194 TaxID=2774629 RepID=UPI003F236E25
MDTEEIYRRMHSGEIYFENPETGAEQKKYNEILYDFNQVRPSDEEKKQELMKKLFASVGDGVYIEPPLRANWGANTHFGNDVYANFNLTLVDDTRIEIGNHVMIGPNVTLSAGTHPLDPELRLKKAQYNLPIVIGDNVWIGAGVIVLPGITIGKNSVIGAGSIVTKDIPENVLAYGTPCVVKKKI